MFKRSGWAAHSTFGLRKEWLALFLAQPETWQTAGILGNKQIESLRVWLKTAGLVNHQGQRTALWHLFQEEGLESLLGWQILWIYVCFNFPTARWYVCNFPSGTWKIEELTSALQKEVPNLSPRTVYNAVIELVGLLERTPVGKELGQGIVEPGRPRRVTRLGYSSPHWQASSCALDCLRQKESLDVFSLSGNFLWPWIIFGCDKQIIIKQFLVPSNGPWKLVDRHVFWARNQSR